MGYIKITAGQHLSDQNKYRKSCLESWKILEQLNFDRTTSVQSKEKVERLGIRKTGKFNKSKREFFSNIY